MKKVLLFPFALIYDLITSLRNLLFDLKILKSKSTKFFSIVVGNLSVGGSGKTPFINYLVQNLLFEHIAVLSRGYGRITKGFHEVSMISLPSEVGDEPLMIFKSNYPKAKVFVQENRVEGALEIEKKLEREHVLLLDDAFQHRWFSPDFQILITEFNRPFTDDLLLPAGRLREARMNANRADVIIVSKVPEVVNNSECNRLESKIRKYCKKECRIFFCNYENTIPMNNAGDKLHLNEKVKIVAGLANNKGFAFFASKDYKITDRFFFKDHFSYTQKDIFRIFKNSNPEKVLTTAKDYIKLKDICTVDQLSKIYFTDTQVKFISGEDQFQSLVINAFKAYQKT